MSTGPVSVTTRSGSWPQRGHQFPLFAEFLFLTRADRLQPFDDQSLLANRRFELATASHQRPDKPPHRRRHLRQQALRNLRLRKRPCHQRGIANFLFAGQTKSRAVNGYPLPATL